MTFNETVGEDRIGLYPRVSTDNTSGQAAMAAHAWSSAGQNDYATARAGIGNSIPEEFGGLHLYNSAQTGAPESISAQAAAATGRATEFPRFLGSPEFPRAVATGAPESISAQAATALESTGAPTVTGTALESTGATATTAAAIDSTSAPAATLSPDQAAIAAATVQLQTPVVTVGPNGELTETQNAGSGFIMNGTDGQQYIVTAGHVPAATGQDGVNGENGQTTYAEGPTTVTFADGTQTTATVAANNTSLTPENSVQLPGNQDITVMSLPYSGVLAPYAALNAAPNAPNPGDTVTAYGYPDGPASQPTAISSTFLGMASASQVANNSNDTTPMLDTTGAGVHGMSGGPVLDSNGGVVGVYTEGTSSNTLDTPISNATNLMDSQNPFSPNYFYNLFNSTPQPIATPNDPGNGSDQSLTGITLNRGGTTTYLDAPATTPAPATPEAPATTPAPATPEAPATTPAPATPEAPAPAATPPIDAPPAATTPMDTPPAYTAPPADTGGDVFGGGDFFGGGGGGEVMGDELDF